MVAVKSSVETVLRADTELSFTSTTLDLKRATALLARIADRKSSIPVLQYTAICVLDRAVQMVATDLNLSATVRIELPAGSDRKTGAFMVNAKALADHVKSLPPSDVNIARAGALGLTVSCGNVSHVLHGAAFRDFPKIPDASELPWHEASAETFADMIGACLPSVCKDETRFHLNGVLYANATGERAIMVATDGHRLTKIQSDLVGPPTSGVIIPAKAATEIKRLLDEGKRQGTCEIALHGPHMFVRYGAVTLACKLIDAQFPPYEQVIPKAYKVLATVDRKALIAALRRAKESCSETRGVKLTLAAGKLTLTSDNPDVGTATEALAAESIYDRKYDIGANPKYLLDALAQIDGKHVTLGCNDELAPICIRGTEHAVSFSVESSPLLSVVMPMRI